MGNHFAVNFILIIRDADFTPRSLCIDHLPTGHEGALLRVHADKTQKSLRVFSFISREHERIPGFVRSHDTEPVHAVRRPLSPRKLSKRHQHFFRRSFAGALDLHLAVFLNCIAPLRLHIFTAFSVRDFHEGGPHPGPVRIRVQVAHSQRDRHRRHSVSVLPWIFSEIHDLIFLIDPSRVAYRPADDSPPHRTDRIAYDHRTIAEALLIRLPLSLTASKSFVSACSRCFTPVRPSRLHRRPEDISDYQRVAGSVSPKSAEPHLAILAYDIFSVFALQSDSVFHLHQLELPRIHRHLSPGAAVAHAQEYLDIPAKIYLRLRTVLTRQAFPPVKKASRITSIADLSDRGRSVQNPSSPQQNSFVRQCMIFRVLRTPAFL